VTKHRQKSVGGGETPLTPHQEFFAAIGRFAVTWAGLEFCLDLLLLSIMSRHGNSQQEVKFPYQLRDKIALARSKIADFDSDHRAAISELLNEIWSYADNRHDFIQGGMVNYYIEEGVITATLWRLLQPRGRARRKPVKVTALEITLTSDRIHSLGDRLLNIAQTLLQKR
jgi:hypothetical protein